MLKKASTKVFVFILIVAVTEVFRFGAVLLNTSSISPISILLLISFVIYSFINLGAVKFFFKDRIFVAWVFILGIYPLLGNIIHFMTGEVSSEFLIQQMGIDILNTLIFVTTAILTTQLSFSKLKVVLYCILIISVVGLYLSLTYPIIFKDVISMASGKVLSRVEKEDVGRAFGFFIQSNVAGLSLICYAVVLFMDANSKKGLPRTVIIYCVLLICILSTGSRSALLTYFLLTIIFILPSTATKISMSYKTTRQNGYVMIFVLLGLIIPMLIIGAEHLFSSLDDSRFADLEERISFFFGGDITDKLSEDTSIEGRILAQKEYLKHISTSPIIGYGPQMSSIFRKNGSFWNSSHNLYLEIVFSYGAIYLLFFISTMIKTALNKSVLRQYKFNAIGALIFVTTLLGFSNSSILQTKSFLFALGVCIGCRALSKISYDKRPVKEQLPVDFQ